MPNFFKKVQIHLKGLYKFSLLTRISHKYFYFKIVYKKDVIKYFILFLIAFFSVNFIIKIKNNYKQNNKIFLCYLKAPCPDFIGRKEYLEKLYKQLLGNQKTASYQSHARIQELWGKGGYGKSEIAIEFANRYRKNFSLIWTFNCDTYEHIEQGYRELAKHLYLAQEQGSFSTIKKQVDFYLENANFSRPWLLIFDDLNDLQIDFPQRRGVILITSQKKIIGSENTLEVGPLSKEESIQLFEKITHEHRGRAMEILSDELDGIPLLINHAAHYIEATPGCNISHYQKHFSKLIFEKNGIFWSELDINQRYFKSVATSWQFTLKSLEQDNPYALEWLYLCSYLYSEQIPEEWIDDWLNEKNIREDKFLKRKEILKSLQSYGIIRYETKTKTYSIHKFFLYTIRENRKSFIQQDVGQAITVLAKHASNYQFADFSSWKYGSIWYVHACELRKQLNSHSISLKNEIQEKEALIFQGIAEWCNYHNRFLESLEANYKALDLIRLAQGDDTLEAGNLYSRIGWVLFQLGKYSKALVACQRAKQIHNCFLDQNSISYADNCHTEGLIFLEQGKYQEALEYHQIALSIRLQTRGEMHVDVGRSYHNIAVTLRELGRYQEALEFHEKALFLFQKICGEKHPLYIRVLQNKGWVVFDLGQYSKALKLFEQGLSLNFQILGKKHGNLAYSYNGIGWCNFKLKNFKKARQAFKKALQLGLKNHGKTARSVIRAYKGLGWSYVKSGNIEKGLKYLTQQLIIGSKVYQSSPKTISMLEDFKKALEEVKAFGRNEKEIDLATNQAYIVSKDLFGLHHTTTILFQP